MGVSRGVLIEGTYLHSAQLFETAAPSRRPPQHKRETYLVVVAVGVGRSQLARSLARLQSVGRTGGSVSDPVRLRVDGLALTCRMMSITGSATEVTSSVASGQPVHLVSQARPSLAARDWCMRFSPSKVRLSHARPTLPTSSTHTTAESPRLRPESIFHPSPSSRLRQSFPAHYYTYPYHPLVRLLRAHT